MTIKKTIMFIAPGTFYYGQGEDIVDCFADAKSNNENFEEHYKFGFDITNTVKPKKIVDTQHYCVCYDDKKDYGQKAFVGTGARIKTKVLELCCQGRVDAMWVFDMQEKISTKKLVETIKKNPKDYKRVATWLEEEEW